MIRARPCISADGYISMPDGRPAMFAMPAWDSSTDYGFPEFVAECDAVVMGRTTFEPALHHHRWPWPGKRVYVLTSTPLPDEAPDDVIVGDTVAGLVEQIRSTERSGDVHLVGGAQTIRAFQEAGALDRLELVVLPILLGEGLPLTPPDAPASSMRLESHRVFPDGAVEHVYSFA
jgi:dihydrofolate reductase